MYTSPNMKLQVPVIGADNDPAWQSEIVYTFNKIDSHTHDGTSSGVKIPFNSLNLTSPGGFSPLPSMDDNPLVEVKYLSFNYQSSLLPVASSQTSVLEVNAAGDLYYITPFAQVKLSGSTAVALSGNAVNGITGGIYQLTGGNVSYTANTGASTSYFNPGFNTPSAVYISNIFTFSTTTAQTGPSTPAANIAANTFYAVGNTNPGLFLYDLVAATNVAGDGIGAPRRAGYAIDLVTQGSIPSNISIQAGFRGHYSRTSLQTHAIQPTYVFAVNSSFSGTALTSSGVVPYQHVFNADFLDARAPVGDTAGYHFVNFDMGTNASPNPIMTYTQYSISTTSGTGQPAAAFGDAGYGMMFRYNLQMGGTILGATPSTAHTREVARDEYYWTDPTNLQAAFRLQLSAGSTLLATPSFVLGYAPGIGVAISDPALQGVIGRNAQRSTYFPGPVLTSGAKGFIWAMPLYVASTVFISPTQDNTSAVGQPLARFANVYANAITPATSLTITGNVAVSGALTAATGLLAASYIPTAAWGAGGQFGLYTNNRTVAVGFVTFVGAGPSAGVTGMNLATASIVTDSKFGHNGFALTITMNTPAPNTNYAVLTSIAGIFTGGSGDGFAIQRTDIINAQSFVIGIYNLTNTAFPSSGTINIQVIQYG
jgi:hypothetical protein